MRDQKLDYKTIRLASRGDIEAIKHTLEMHPVLLNTPMEGHNRTLLWEAVRFHRKELVQYLLEQGSDPNIPGRYRNETLVLCKPWVIAKIRNYRDLERLLAPATDLDIFSAAYVGNEEWVKQSLTNKPQIINQHQPEETLWLVTPLHHAVSGGHPVLATRLIENGANVVEHSALLLDIALRRKRIDLVELLLNHGALANQAPVFAALQCGSRELFMTLVESGMPVNEKINSRWPPLAYVCRGDKGQHPQRVQWLLNAGADINATAPHGMTALHVAARAGFDQVVLLLLERGANPSTVNDKGRTALQLAVHANRHSTVALLQKYA